MKKVIFLLILAATPLLGRASHIVGGEFELIHLQDAPYHYRLNLIIYFDLQNGSPGAKDDTMRVAFYRLRDNVRITTLLLRHSTESPVDYTQLACSKGELRTLKIIYTAVITLPPTSFDDPGGYYVSWERCCRNYSITNIYSQDPNNGGIRYAGQTFYLEFPPVVKDGEPFVDSTPKLFPPLSDYACTRKPYYKDFSGTDDDGDSLVYSLVTPLNTKTNEATPPPRPKPYPDVTWRSPYNLDHVINGLPDLRISQDGFLTVTPPAVLGLFVFAVKVEEFRDKVKIGETRRDFQMLVIDCARAVPPEILGSTSVVSPSYVFKDVMTVPFIPRNATDDQRTIKVRVTDDDSRAAPDGDSTEHIRIKAIPLNFKGDVSGILIGGTEATLVNGGSVEFTIRFSKCPYFLGGPALIGIVAMDDACALPLTDTLKVSVTVEPPLNTRPHFILPGINPWNEPPVIEGNSISEDWSVVDGPENDPLIITVITDGFVLKKAGMTFDILHQIPGAVDGKLNWDAFCDIYDFTGRKNFKVTILAEDQDQCNLPDPVKQVFNLSVDLPPNVDPIIDTDLTSDPAERRVTGITRRVNESLSFSIKGVDPDPDVISMNGAGTDFKIDAYGVALVPSPATGTGTIASKFQWDIKCSTVDLKKKDHFDFQFIVVDNKNKCRFYRTDTVDVEVQVLPPLNAAPQLTIFNQNATLTTLSANAMSITRGPSINLMLQGTDTDTNPGQDNLKLQLVAVDGNVKPEGYSFTDVAGKSPLLTTFNWTPDCTIFKGDVYENEYTFTFRISDDHCITAKKDSVQIKLKIKDIDGSSNKFIPPNFFSPNGDNINDYFAMEAKDAATGEIRNILPNDNCASKFEGVRIYNRWGNLVFQSDDRDFKWYGPGESAGVYFYHINFTQREYRGSLSLRY